MSRKKHSVAYIKPDEPKFLRELKEKAGYQEGPTIETKRETLEEDSGDERDEKAEEQPVVVVLSSGDMTAEEADAFQKGKEEEEANAPADLSKRILFRKSKATDVAEAEAEDKPVKKKSKKTKKEKVVLSFNDEEEDYS